MDGNGSGVTARRVLGGAAAALVAAAIGWGQLGPAPATGAADCASLGQAAHFVAFSHGDFNASPPGGENITGRIAAAGDVTLGGPGSAGVFVGGAAGDTAPTVIAGHDLSAGRSGAGGTLNGGATYGNAVSIAPNFFVTPPATHAPAPFSFDDEFTSLRTLSASLADQPQSSGATVSLNPYSHALELTGTADGLNVFTVSAAQLTQAVGVTITLTKAGATALINVTTDTDLAVSLQYENLSGVSAAHVAWNLALATSLTISNSVSWQGLVLAPNAMVTMASNGQFNGEVIAASIPAANRTLTKVAFTGCLPPPPPPDESLTLTALCVRANGNLTMRLRNTGDRARSGTWVDLGGTDFGDFAVPAHHDLFFDVEDPQAHSVIEATSGTTTVRAAATRDPCQGQITLRLVTTGPAPAGASWDVRLDAGLGGGQVFSLGSGEEHTTTVPGGYVPGAAPIDQVVGGVAYTVSVDDTLGGTATVSLNPVEILDGQHEIVTVTIAFDESGGGPGTWTRPRTWTRTWTWTRGAERAGTAHSSAGRAAAPAGPASGQLLPRNRPGDHLRDHSSPRARGRRHRCGGQGAQRQHRGGRRRRRPRDPAVPPSSGQQRRSGARCHHHARALHEPPAGPLQPGDPEPRGKRDHP